MDLKIENNIHKLFFQLIRVAIGNAVCLSHTPKAEEWQMLYEMAKKQSLLGISFVGVNKLSRSEQCPSKMLYSKWRAAAIYIKQRNETLNRQCTELKAMLLADGMRSCILKGQGVAALYQDLSSFRQSGDIDIWVDAPLDSVLRYAIEKTSSKDFDEKHIHFNYFKGTDVEMHWVPVYWYSSLKNYTLQKYISGARESEFANGGYPTLEFQLVHQLLHLYGHYVYEGIGLRQVMDLYYTICAINEGKKDEHIINNVVTLLGKLGLMQFVKGTQWVLKEVLGMPENMMISLPDEDEGLQILEEIMLCGNFGHFDVRYNNRNKGVFQRLCRRWSRKLRMFRYDPVSVFMTPFARVGLEIWIRRKRRHLGIN